MSFLKSSLICLPLFLLSSIQVDAKNIRIGAANLSSGKNQSYDLGHGVRILKGLRIDIALLQEFNYKNQSREDFAEMTSAIFGEVGHVCRENESTDQIPNGVISRYPIKLCGEWSDSFMPNRDYVYAQIDIPGPRDLWVISVHLSNKKYTTRVEQSKELLAHIQEMIPQEDYLVIGGDFNAVKRDEKMIEVLSSRVSEKSPPVDEQGRTETNRNRNKNYDWLLVSPELATHQVPTILAGVVFPNGMVFDHSSFSKKDQLAHIQEGDSTAEGMQHFPVVKDFWIKDVESEDEGYCDSYYDPSF